MVELTVDEDGATIGGTSFHLEELDAIETRIERNEFDDLSTFGFGDGIALLRDGDTIKLVKPKGAPKESWSFDEWVENSSGWKVYGEGTREEWLEEFESS